MNPESNHLMYLMADPSVFENYHVDASGFTPLESGKVVAHMALCGNMGAVAMKDERVVGHTHEGLLAYIEWVDGYKGSTDEVL